MNFDVSLLFLLILFFIVICVIAGIRTWYKEFKRKMRRNMRGMSNIVSGVGDIVELIKENEQVIQTTPKTLSVTESIYLDKIRKDFPELNLNLVKSNVNEIVSDYFKYLQTGNNSELKKDCTENFLSQVSSFVDNKIRNDIKFHRTVINGYSVDGEEAKLLLQTSCQYINEKNTMVQTRFELSYVYFLEHTPETKTVSLQCPNCGAPIDYTGAKVCKYCDTMLVSTIKRTWKFDSIREF